MVQSNLSFSIIMIKKQVLKRRLKTKQNKKSKTTTKTSTKLKIRTKTSKQTTATTNPRRTFHFMRSEQICGEQDNRWLDFVGSLGATVEMRQDGEHMLHSERTMSLKPKLIPTERTSSNHATNTLHLPDTACGVVAGHYDTCTMGCYRFLVV